MMLKILSCAYCPFAYFLWRNVFSNLLSILVFVLLCCKGSLYILDTRTLRGKLFASISSHSVEYLFTLLMMSCAAQFFCCCLFLCLFVCFLNKFIYLLIYLIFGCFGSSLLHAGFLQLLRGGLLFVAVHRLLIAVASLVAEHGLQAHGLQQLWHMGFSSCGSQALEHRLSSCGTWAQLLHGMWDLPGPGLKPVSPALAGRFLTTAPPGKPPV